jgi:glycosyltransferase involved in cell wall biosynthesis
MNKILISSEYLTQTGFATVCENIADMLKHNNEVAIVDYSRKHDHFFRTNGVVFMGNPNPEEDRWAINKILELIDSFDTLFIINDIWNIDEILESIKKSGKKLPKIVIYFPVDAKGHMGHWYKHMDIVSSIVTYTQFAKDVAAEAMRSDFADRKIADEIIDRISIIPHGINRQHYYRIEDKNSIRREAFGTDKYDDAFIVLNANRNQPRKKLDITIKAFAQYLKTAKVDSYLYMHCAILDCYIDVYNYAKRVGIQDNLILSCPLENPHYRPSLSNEQMNLLYNACDVGINTSLGEGWGLCSVEQASLGVPQIVPNHSACAEIFTKSEANFIECPTELVMNNIMTVGKLADVNSASYQIYLMSDYIYRSKKAAISFEKFNADCYSWEEDIADAWITIFDNLKDTTIHEQLVSNHQKSTIL